MPLCCTLPLLILLLVSHLGFAPSSQAFPVDFTQGPAEATLQGDGSILIKPGERIAVEYELTDGKIGHLKKVPLNSPQAAHRFTISLQREGGVATSLGPVSPINDRLIFTSTNQKPLSARLEYKMKDAKKSGHSRLSAPNGSGQRSFLWGVSEITISEIQFIKP